MAAALFYFAALAAFVAAGTRIRRARTSDNKPATLCYAVLLAALGAAFAFMATPSQAWVNRYEPDLFKLLGNSMTLVAACAGQGLVLYTRFIDVQRLIDLHARVRRRTFVLLGALAVLWVMYLLPHPAPLTGAFDGLYGRDPSLAIYTVVYALYLGATMVDVGVLCWGYSRYAHRWLRRGLRIITASSLLGIVYAFAKIATVVARVVSRSRAQPGNAAGVCHAAFVSPGCTVVVGLPVITVSLLAAGVLICASAPRIDLAALRREHRRAAARLAPLVTRLRAAFPEQLDAADESTEEPEPDQELADRLLASHDGLLLLAPYRNAEVGEDAFARARRAGERDPEAVAEAAEIVTALRAYANGASPDVATPNPPHTAGEDPSEDNAWLQRIARALSTATVASYDRPLSGEESR